MGKFNSILLVQIIFLLPDGAKISIDFTGIYDFPKSYLNAVQIVVLSSHIIGYPVVHNLPNSVHNVGFSFTFFPIEIETNQEKKL